MNSHEEMGDCLLEKASLSDDEYGGRVLLMLTMVQFDIQKLLDTYEMKRQCDDKRYALSSMYGGCKIWYDEIKHKHKERRRLRLRLGSNKSKYVSSSQVQYLISKSSVERGFNLILF